MDKKLERNIIWSLAIILIVLGLTSCAGAPLKVMSKPVEEKILFRTQRQPVEAGAHGTLNYTIKKGVNKNKIANSNIIKSK